MRTPFILLVAGILFGSTLVAQEKTVDERRGDRYHFNYNYTRAIRAYTSTNQLTSGGQRALAESYRKLDQNEDAEAAYASLIVTGTGIIPEDYYNYAMVLKSNGKYSESNLWMQKFAELKPSDVRVLDYWENRSRLAGLLINNPELDIEHQTFNTDASDFGTTFFDNSVLFASTRSNRKLFVSRYNWTHQPFWDLYSSEINDGQLQTPTLFAPNLNGKLHDGPASFSNQNSFMAFTRNHYRDKSTDKVVELQIWFSTLRDGKWSNPEPFAHNNNAYSVGHPCLSPDGKSMYFSSDMPGGVGGTDIYKSTKNSIGAWDFPQNLGNTINTEGDETFPYYIGTSQILLFSSNGRFGLGGLDVFVSHLQGNLFSPPYNPGAPLNTRYDDFAAIVDSDMNHGYFTSNRPDGNGSDDIYALTLKEPDLQFTVAVPGEVPVVRTIRETFPLRNYIFFTKGSTEIPDRYVLLTKAQAVEFKEDRLEEFTSKNPAGRSIRQMNVYYNVINILGNRMSKFPEAGITLVGSSENGVKDAEAMAVTVKNYLVSVFGIKGSRIKTEGREKPKLPSEQTGGINELIMLREGDQRVSIESNSPAILMEFLSGPDAPIKPVELITRHTAAVKNDVLFTVKGARTYLRSWSMNISDTDHTVRHFGPFTEETIGINRISLAGGIAKGTLKATMTGKTHLGKVITKVADVETGTVVQPRVEEVMRFSIIYEFDDARAIRMYEKYLTDIVTPKIPLNGKVIIRGYTDIIGDEDYNQQLSLARANDVKTIMEASLQKAGRKDVEFEVSGYGEDERHSPFDNNYPEQRFYNRTVIVDIVHR